jgi:hypothetical protein
MSDQCLHTRDPEPVCSMCIGSRFLRAAAASVMLLAACTTTQQPRYADIPATVPPVAADRVRLYFYRDYEPYESLARPYIYLNNQPSAISEPGGVFYRDVPQGSYVVTVDSYGIFPEQSKTVAAKVGETYYIKVESLRSWASGGGANDDYERDTFVVVLVDPERARHDIPNLRFFRGP